MAFDSASGSERGLTAPTNWHRRHASTPITNNLLILNQQRIFPLLFIVAAHLLMLQLFIGFHIRVPPPIVVVPIEVYSVPVITKFAALPAKKVPQKTITPHVPVPNPTVLPETASPIAEQTVVGAPARVSEPSAPAVRESTPQVADNPPAAPSTSTLLILPPPSARYLMDMVRTEPNVEHPYYGSGEIQWEHDEKNYHMHLEAGLDLFVTKIVVFSVDSEGTIGLTGIKPVMMTETRRGRSPTATHFNYDSNIISFSAKTATIPLSEGAQDRATLLMQLASIGNADPSQFQNGKEITIQVAEDNDASPFQLVVVGKETIDTRLGHFETWHIVRPPKPGYYSSRLDIWVAPTMSWLPIQLRITERKGETNTLTIRKIITGVH